MQGLDEATVEIAKHLRCNVEHTDLQRATEREQQALRQKQAAVVEAKEALITCRLDKDCLMTALGIARGPPPA